MVRLSLGERPLLPGSHAILSAREDFSPEGHPNFAMTKPAASGPRPRGLRVIQTWGSYTQR